MNQIVAVVISYHYDDVLNATPSDSLSFFDTEEENQMKKHCCLNTMWWLFIWVVVKKVGMIF